MAIVTLTDPSANSRSFCRHPPKGGTGAGLSSIVRGAVPVALFGTDGLGLRLGRLAAIRNVLGAAAPFLFAFAAERLGLRGTLVLTALFGTAGFLVTALLWRDLRRAALPPPGLAPGA